MGSHDSLNYEEYYADKNCVMYLVCFLLLPSTSLQLSEKNEEPNYNPVFFVWPFILIKLKKNFFLLKITELRIAFKETVSAISSDPPCKYVNVRFTTLKAFSDQV